MATTNSIDLSSVLSANQKAIRAQDLLGQQSTDVNAIVQGAIESSRQNALRLSSAEETLAREGELAIQKKEELTSRIAQQFGANPDAQGYVLGNYAAGIIKATNDMEAAHADITQKQGIDFIDNPLGYLAARTSINSDIDRYNNAASLRDNYSTSIQNLEIGASNAAKIAQSTVVTSNEATLNANVIKAGYTGLQTANEATRQSAAANLQHFVAIAGVSKEQAVLMGTSFTQVREQKQLEIAYAHLALSREAAARSAENDKFNQYIKEQKLDADQIDSNLVARGYQTLNGGKVMPPELMKSVRTFLDKKDLQFLAWYNSGRESYGFDSTGGTSVVSNSPADVVKLASLGYIKNATPGMVTTIDYLKTQQMQFKNQAVQNTPAGDKSDHTVIDRAYNDFVKSDLKRTSQNVPRGSILEPIGLAEAAKSANFAQYPVWNKVFKPLAEAGAKLDDPNIVDAALLAAVRSRTITLSEAADIAPMYATSMRMTGVARNFMGLGLADINQGYTTKSSLGLINRTDSAAMSTAINKTLATSTVLQAMRTLTPIGGVR